MKPTAPRCTTAGTDELFARFIQDGDADPLAIATSASRPLPAGEVESLVADLRRISEEIKTGRDSR